MKFPALFLTASLLTALPCVRATDVAKEPPPKIEVCFVLDTTGSMGGLIEGAKQKIWSIANEMVKTKPTPEVKISLIGFRDKGDEYVVKSYPLTDDIDAIYAKLKAFEAGGGGDTPESVNEALAEAVRKIEWSQDRKVLKLIFLVGDAPPHMDYADGPKYPALCQEAVKKDLIINTVQCGAAPDTLAIWKEIASLSEGRFAAIGQTGDVVVIATPMDKDLAELNAQVGKTIVPYGKPEEQKEVLAKQSRSDESFAKPASAPAAADRLRYNATTGKGVQGKNELVNDAAAKPALLGKLEESELPENMKGMTATEREKYVKEQWAKREELQKKIAELSRKREEYIIAEKKKSADEKGATKDAFDDEVAKTIHEQAAKKGIKS